MIDTYLRRPYQKILVDPIAKRVRFHPNSITLIGAITGLTIIPLLATHHTLYAFACLIFSGYLDTLDGTIARLRESTSPKGTVLDILSDRLVETAICIGLFTYAPDRALPCLLMLGSILLCITSFLVVGIFSENQTEKSFYYSPGIIERTEAFLFFGAMMALPSLFTPLAYTFAALVTLTAAVRAYQFLTVDQSV